MSAPTRATHREGCVDLRIGLVDDPVRSKIMESGNPSAGLLTVTDPNTGANVTLLANWRLVAVALVLEDHPGAPIHGGSYA